MKVKNFRTVRCINIGITLTLAFSIPRMAASAETAADESAPHWLHSIYGRMDHDNNELQMSKLGTAFSHEDRRAARAALYPTLSFSSAANKGKKTNAPSAMGATSVSDPSLSNEAGASEEASVGVDSGSVSTAIPTSSDGAVHQISTSYILFSQFAISENIHKADLSISKARLGERAEKEKKRSQLLQLIIEWQWLDRLREPLLRADKAFATVEQSSSRPAAQALYSDVERTDLTEKRTTVEYYNVKVSEGRGLVELALRDLVPDLRDDELTGFPRILLKYELPPEGKIQDLYREKSLSEQRSRLDIESAQSAVRVASWQRPWIPVVALNGSASQSRSFSSGTRPVDNWSVGLLLNFNVFDGSLRDARRQQAGIALDFAERKQRFERDKSLLYLRHQRMKALVAMAEFRRRKVFVARKGLLLGDVRRKRRLGVATALEESGAELDLVKAKLDALESLKDQQSAALSIAVELGELDKVQIEPVTGEGI